MQDAIDIKVLRTLGMARDRPSPYGNGDGFLFLTVARGPVPRDALPFHRSAGACPPRSLICLKQEQDFHDFHDFQDYLPHGEHFFPMDASSGPLGPACL